MIPIYRAKKIDSDGFVEGIGLISLKNSYFLLPNADGLNFILLESGLGNLADEFVIDANTLAIHFHSMLDKNGNKIFASLSEDGVGGDIDKHRGDIIGVRNGQVCLITSITSTGITPKTIEVIGIHNG